MECLTPDQKAQVERHGYLLLENRIPPDWLKKRTFDTIPAQEKTK
jgi:hypothetical protein